MKGGRGNAYGGGSRPFNSGGYSPMGTFGGGMGYQPRGFSAGGMFAQPQSFQRRPMTADMFDPNGGMRQAQGYAKPSLGGGPSMSGAIPTDDQGSFIRGGVNGGPQWDALARAGIRTSPSDWMPSERMGGAGMNWGGSSPDARFGGSLPRGGVMGGTRGDPPGAFGFGTKPAIAPQQQWQPSFGGHAPNPFLPQQAPGYQRAIGDGYRDYSGGISPPPSPTPPTFETARISDPPGMGAQWSALKPGVNPGVMGQRTGGVMNEPPFMGMQEKAATTGRPPPQTMPPQPTGPMQPGQAGWQWGPDLTGNRDTPFGWRPQFGGGYNDYIVQMLNGGQAPWAGQVDRNNIIGSIGQLSGRQFDPSSQSSFNTLLWGR